MGAPSEFRHFLPQYRWNVFFLFAFFSVVYLRHDVVHKGSVFFYLKLFFFCVRYRAHQVTNLRKGVGVGLVTP